MAMTLKQCRTQKKLRELTANGQPMNSDRSWKRYGTANGLPKATSKSKLATYLADFNRFMERRKAERKSPRNQRFIRGILKRVTSQG